MGERVDTFLGEKGAVALRENEIQEMKTEEKLER